MKLSERMFAVSLLLVLGPVACPSQNFSADVVFVDAKANAGSLNSDSSAHKASRLFVSEDKMRLDMFGPDGIILLVDTADQTAFALFPAKREYAPLAAPFSEYFRVKDPENACSDWQKVSAQKVDCEKVGYETVDGRQALKYRNNRISDIVPSAVWVDPKLKFVVKWESGEKSAELRNIREARQTEDLFTLPSGYDVPKPKKTKSKGFSQ